MKNDKHLYPYSYEEAVRLNEVDKWGESLQKNRDCAWFIQDKINKQFDGLHVPSDTIPAAIEQFGFQRVNRVLASTILSNLGDGRISRENKAWAESRQVYESATHRRDYELSTHPGITDILAKQARRLWKELGLFSHEQVIPETSFSHLENKVLLVKPEKLREEYMKPEHQLFYATHGNGCNPNAAGTSVFGVYLVDGEKAAFTRDCFLGEIQPELMPKWAEEKLEMYRLGVTEEEYAAIDPTCGDPVGDEMTME